MQTNEKYSIPLFFGDKDEEIKMAFNNLKEENRRLQLENEELKRELEKEQLLHKNLYNEWKELKSGTTAKKNGRRKIKRFIRKRSSFYGLFIITILLAAFIVYLAFSNMAVTNINSSQIPSLTDTVARDTTSKNKIQELNHGSSVAKPTVKPRQKKNAAYSLNKNNIDPYYQNESAGNNESIGLQKIDSGVPAN